MPPIKMKVGICSEYERHWQQLRETHQAAIRETHRNIAIFAHQRQDMFLMLRKLQRNFQYSALQG